MPREISQILRALEAEGPVERDALDVLVGGRYWGLERFDRALRLAVSDGVVIRNPDGRYRVAEQA